MIYVLIVWDFVLLTCIKRNGPQLLVVWAGVVLLCADM